MKTASQISNRTQLRQKWEQLAADALPNHVRVISRCLDQRSKLGGSGESIHPLDIHMGIASVPGVTASRKFAALRGIQSAAHLACSSMSASAWIYGQMEDNSGCDSKSAICMDQDLQRRIECVILALLDALPRSDVQQAVWLPFAVAVLLSTGMNESSAALHLCALWVRSTGWQDGPWLWSGEHDRNPTTRASKTDSAPTLGDDGISEWKAPGPADAGSAKTQAPPSSSPLSTPPSAPTAALLWPWSTPAVASLCMAIGDRLLLSSPAACVDLARLGAGPADAVAAPLACTLGLGLGLPMHCIAVLWDDVLTRGGTAISVAAQSLLDRATGALQEAEAGALHDGAVGVLRHYLRGPDPSNQHRTAMHASRSLFSMRLPGERRRLGPALAKSEAWRRARSLQVHLQPQTLAPASVDYASHGLSVGHRHGGGSESSLGMRLPRWISEPWLVPPLVRPEGGRAKQRAGAGAGAHGMTWSDASSSSSTTPSGSSSASTTASPTASPTATAAPQWLGFDADHTLIRYATPGMPLRMFQEACRGVRAGKVPPLSPRLLVAMGDAGGDSLPVFSRWDGAKTADGTCRGSADGMATGPSDTGASSTPTPEVTKSRRWELERERNPGDGTAHAIGPRRLGMLLATGTKAFGSQLCRAGMLLDLRLGCVLRLRPDGSVLAGWHGWRRLGPQGIDALYGPGPVSMEQECLVPGAGRASRRSRVRRAREQAASGTSAAVSTTRHAIEPQGAGEAHTYDCRHGSSPERRFAKWALMHLGGLALTEVSPVVSVRGRSPVVERESNGIVSIDHDEGQTAMPSTNTGRPSTLTQHPAHGEDGDVPRERVMRPSLAAEEMKREALAARGAYRRFVPLPTLLEAVAAPLAALIVSKVDALLAAAHSDILQLWEAVLQGRTAPSELPTYVLAVDMAVRAVRHAYSKGASDGLRALRQKAGTAVVRTPEVAAWLRQMRPPVLPASAGAEPGAMAADGDRSDASYREAEPADAGRYPRLFMISAASWDHVDPLMCQALGDNKWWELFDFIVCGADKAGLMGAGRVMVRRRGGGRKGSAFLVGESVHPYRERVSRAMSAAIPRSSGAPMRYATADSRLPASTSCSIVLHRLRSDSNELEQQQESAVLGKDADGDDGDVGQERKAKALVELEVSLETGAVDSRNSVGGGTESDVDSSSGIQTPPYVASASSQSAGGHGLNRAVPGSHPTASLPLLSPEQDPLLLPDEDQSPLRPLPGRHPAFRDGIRLRPQWKRDAGIAPPGLAADLSVRRVFNGGSRASLVATLREWAPPPQEAGRAVSGTSSNVWYVGDASAVDVVLPARWLGWQTVLVTADLGNLTDAARGSGIGPKEGATDTPDGGVQCTAAWQTGPGPAVGLSAWLQRETGTMPAQEALHRLAEPEPEPASDGSEPSQGSVSSSSSAGAPAAAKGRTGVSKASQDAHGIGIGIESKSTIDGARATQRTLVGLSPAPPTSSMAWLEAAANHSGEDRLAIGSPRSPSDWQEPLVGAAGSIGGGFLGIESDLRWHCVTSSARLCIPSVAWWARVQRDVSQPLLLGGLREHMRLPQDVTGALAPSDPVPAASMSIWQRMVACFSPRDRAKERSLLGGRASPRLIMESAMALPARLPRPCGTSDGATPSDTSAGQHSDSNSRLHRMALLELTGSFSEPDSAGAWRWDLLFLAMMDLSGALDT